MDMYVDLNLPKHMYVHACHIMIFCIFTDCHIISCKNKGKGALKIPFYFLSLRRHQ